MKKLLFSIFFIISFLNADSLFGDTEEERIESQKKMLGIMGNSVVEVFKGAGKLIISPVTDKIKENEQEKEKDIEDKERADAKKKLLEQMNN